MPLFSYKATNDDNKEVRGSIDSADEMSARKALEDLHLDILEISETSHQHTPPTEIHATQDQLPVFAFEGKDTGGLVRRGTIQAATKYAAFKKLRDDQKLFVAMLSPVGVLPQYKDPELDQWQRAARPSVGFTSIPSVEVKKSEPPAAVRKTASGQYHPLASTLRLYAGWLLAWYALFVVVGYYSLSRALPWDIPFVQAFYVSPLIFGFIVAIFLFLLFSALHKMLKGGLLTGIVLTIAGAAVFASVHIFA